MLSTRESVPSAPAVAPTIDHTMKSVLPVMDVPSDPPVLEEVEMEVDDNTVEYQADWDAKAQREDALMELVEFALEMDTRKPKKLEAHSLVRSSSASEIHRESHKVLRRTKSITERPVQEGNNRTLTAWMRGLDIGL